MCKICKLILSVLSKDAMKANEIKKKIHEKYGIEISSQQISLHIRFHLNHVVKRCKAKTSEKCKFKYKIGTSQ